jgi:hypothetical protein
MWSVLLLQGVNPIAFKYTYTGCSKMNVLDLGRVFLMLKYTDRTLKNYIQSWRVTEIIVREIWMYDSFYTLIDYQTNITGSNM